jgi:ribosomal protein S18 acetylase RimI-like enzyme
MRPNSAIELREFQIEQTDELVAMWRSSFEFGVGIADPHPISEQREYFLSNVLPNNAVVVAMRYDRIVGFTAASAEAIAQLYVHVEHHRKGIGSLLLNWAKQNSDGNLWLHTFECNVIARNFYERYGFCIEERGFEEMWQLPDLKYSWSERALEMDPIPNS